MNTLSTAADAWKINVRFYDVRRTVAEHSGFSCDQTSRTTIALPIVGAPRCVIRPNLSWCCGVVEFVRERHKWRKNGVAEIVHNYNCLPLNINVGKKNGQGRRADGQRQCK